MAEVIGIIGAGGHGRVVADLVGATGRQVGGFFDRDATKRGLEVASTGTTVLLTQTELLAELERGQALPAGLSGLAFGLGHNIARDAIMRALPEGYLPVLVHPSATVSPSAMLGPGTVVLAGAVVNTGARVGRGVIINTGAIVEHDCVVGDAAHVSPGAVLSGGVRLGLRGWVGANATILPGRSIGDDAVVGAGAVCLEDVANGLTVAGNPARLLTRRES